MKTVKNNKETKKVPNYLEMVRLYGANAVCNMLNNL